MAKYSELDPLFLRRYFDLLVKHGRGVDKKYSNNRCGKEMFVARTMRKWLKNKCFVVIQKDPTGAYATTNQNDPSSYYEVRIPILIRNQIHLHCLIHDGHREYPKAILFD